MNEKAKKIATAVSATLVGSMMAVMIMPAFANTQHTYYTVVKGDTLSAIARKYNTTVDNLVAANNISNKNLIYVNQQLVIPTGSTGSTGSSDLASYQYRVVSGDNLYRIAIRYNTTVAQLAAWNNISNTRLIYVGDILQVMEVSGSIGSQTQGATTSTSTSTSTDTSSSADAATPNMSLTPESSTETTVVPEVVAPVVDTSKYHVYNVTEECSVFDVAEIYGVEPISLIYCNVIDDPMALTIGATILVEKQTSTQEVLSAFIGDVDDMEEYYFVVEYEEALEYDEYQRRLTGEEATQESSVPSTVVAINISPDQEEYYVETACSVFDIAVLFQVSSMDLIRWNELDNPMEIPAGSILRVTGDAE